MGGEGGGRGVEGGRRCEAVRKWSRCRGQDCKSAIPLAARRAGRACAADVSTTSTSTRSTAVRSRVAQCTASETATPPTETIVSPTKRFPACRRAGGMHMQHAHAARTCSTHMQHAHAARTCSTHMQHAHAACTCSMHMQHAHAARTCGMHMQHAHAGRREETGPRVGGRHGRRGTDSMGCAGRQRAKGGRGLTKQALRAWSVLRMEARLTAGTIHSASNGRYDSQRI